MMVQYNLTDLLVLETTINTCTQNLYQEEKKVSIFMAFEKYKWLPNFLTIAKIISLVEKI